MFIGVIAVSIIEVFLILAASFIFTLQKQRFTLGFLIFVQIGGYILDPLIHILVDTWCSVIFDVLFVIVIDGDLY